MSGLHNIEHLTDSDATVAVHVCKTIANCTSACSVPDPNAAPVPGDYKHPLQMSAALQSLGSSFASGKSIPVPRPPGDNWSSAVSVKKSELR